jgi:hypothetical protein
MGIPARAISFVTSAANYVSPELVRKGLEKISPKFKSYFAKALSYGLSANQAVDYLASRFSNPNQQEYQQALTQRGQAQQLRPDEMEAQAQQTNSQIPGKLLKTGLALASPLMMGGEEPTPQTLPEESPIQQTAQRASRATAPITQAYKAQEGMATPVIAGRAIAQAQQAPHRLQAALKAKNGPQTALQAPQSPEATLTPFDMLKRNSPEIGAFMEAEMKKGRSPYEAAAAARAKKALQEPITKLEAQAQVPFEGLIAHIFGGGVPQEQEITPTQTVEGGDYRQDLKQLAALIQQYTNAKGAR